MESEIPNKKIAIIFYGLTRSLNKTINSIHENIFNVLKENLIEYDIFIHTYKINGEYKNDWSHENTANYINEDIDKLLKPKYYINDNHSILDVPVLDMDTKTLNFMGNVVFPNDIMKYYRL